MAASPTSSPTADARTIARLHRRLGFGLRAGELTAGSADPRAHATALLDALTRTPTDAADPWGTEDYTVQPSDRSGGRRRAGLRAIATWIDHMVATDVPLPDRIAWTWHGHFVSALTEAKNPQFMVDQMRTFRTAGIGPFADLLRAVTIDPAMLLYLDGNDSTGAAPNENYGREVLELFTIGTGGYTEADVAAGARALSGWRISRTTHAARLIAGRHDDAPQAYLGATGVHGVDQVIAAIVAHPASPTFVTRTWAREIIGPAVTDDVVRRAAIVFTASGLDVGALLTALVEELLAGADGGPVLAAPVPWFVAARRVTGAAPAWRDVIPHLLAAGQVPWLPPNVSGWPSGAAWDNASTLVARFNLAALIVAATPPGSPTLTTTDVDLLAGVLGIAPSWSDVTRSTLAALAAPADRLLLALTSPEFVHGEEPS